MGQASTHAHVPPSERTVEDAFDAVTDKTTPGRGDRYLKSMLLGLIEDSYLHSGTFTQFAAEVLKVLAYAVTVPVAFTEGFLRAYLSIERIVERDDGSIKIVPKKDAAEEDWIRDVDAITAQVDPSAVFNPVVRAQMEAVHEASSKVMKYDLDALSSMSDEELMDVLRQMQRESEARQEAEPVTDQATDYVRARLATIRKNVRHFQARAKGEAGAQATSEAAGQDVHDAGNTGARHSDASADAASADGRDS